MRACERFNVKPWEEFENLPVDLQADILAYSQIREHEEVDRDNKFLSNLVKAMTPKVKK